ncbi:4-fold beta flower protein [Thermodesulfobacteriota bacterium]
MDTTLYNKDGEAIAYIADDYHSTIFLWDGHPVAYLYEQQYVYGINGKHLGWFINEIVFDNNGARIGFTSNTCPIPVAKESVKDEKHSMDQIRPRWAALPLPNLSFVFADEKLSDLLIQGQVAPFGEKADAEETAPEENDA